MTASTFDERAADHFEQLSPAEQRVVRFLQDNREEVLISSAATLASQVGTSDATVIRTVKALGFSSLDDMRRTLAAELRDLASPADRLTKTLAHVGGNLPTAFEATLQIHLQSLESLRRSISSELFETAVRKIEGARRISVFGLGPSNAIASYLVTQLSRFGLDADSLGNTGLLFADDLQRLRRSDMVIILAYGRVYPELAALLDEAERHGIDSILLTDTLAAKLRNRVTVVLPVPRGRADMLSLHTATLGLIEALLVGVASQRPEEALASLESLNEARQRLAGTPMGLPLPETANRA